MYELIIVVLALLLIFLFLKLYKLNRLFAYLAQSLENRSICLIENKDSSVKKLIELQQAVNDIIHENKNLRRLTEEDEAQLNDTLRNIQESVMECLNRLKNKELHWGKPALQKENRVHLQNALL